MSNAIEVIMYKCPFCSEIYSTKQLADECCTKHQQIISDFQKIKGKWYEDDLDGKYPTQRPIYKILDLTPDGISYLLVCDGEISQRCCRIVESIPHTLASICITSERHVCEVDIQYANSVLFKISTKIQKMNELLEKAKG